MSENAAVSITVIVVFVTLVAGLNYGCTESNRHSAETGKLKTEQEAGRFKLCIERGGSWANGMCIQTRGAD